MKLSLRFTSLIFAGLSVLPLHAAEVDPLWAKVVAHSDEGKKWIPKDVEMSVEGNAEGKDEKRKFRLELTGWEKDKPVYKTVSMEPPAEPGKSATKDGSQIDKFSSLSEEMIKIDAKVARKDGQQFEGKPATLFSVDNSKGPMDMTIKVWVDPASGNIYKIQTHAHATLMLDMMLNIAYQSHPSGISMPSKSEMKMEVLIPFKGAKMHLINTSGNWVQRPL